MVGLNVSNYNYNYENPDFEPDTKSKVGGQFGIIGVYDINEMFILQTGLTYQSLGYNVELIGNTANGIARYKTSEIRLPINIGYKYENFRFLLGTYIGLAFDVKTKWNYEINGKKFKDQIDYEIGNNIQEHSHKPLDYGLHFGAGYRSGPMLVQLGYSFGLANLQPEDPDGNFDASENSFKSNNFSIGLTYFFTE